MNKELSDTELDQIIEDDTHQSLLVDTVEELELMSITKVYNPRSLAELLNNRDESLEDY